MKDARKRFQGLAVAAVVSLLAALVAMLPLGPAASFVASSMCCMVAAVVVIRFMDIQRLDKIVIALVVLAGIWGFLFVTVAWSNRPPRGGVELNGGVRPTSPP